MKRSIGVRMVTPTVVVTAVALCCAGIAEAQDFSPVGLTGHLAADVGAPAPGFTYGVSFYNSVYPLNPAKNEHTQLGWGTWLVPNNLTFNTDLCPVGTYARDTWSVERGPSHYRDVFQTIEGGIGSWVSSKFPSSSPKFRVNAVPDCYNTQVGSPGWEFGASERLSGDKIGLAQLSNRMLLPPDGLSFVKVNPTNVFGYGWIALPLIGAHTSVFGAPTGGQNWTLFFHAANYRGPVAFFVPDFWSYLSAEFDYPQINGRGHDARPGLVGGVAMEIGQAPVFTATLPNGDQYRRIPRLTFDVDATGKAILQQDVRFYSKTAIWDAVGEWLDNGTPANAFNPAGIFTPSISGSHYPIKLGGDQISFGSGFYAGALTTSTGNGAFGLRWSAPMEPGVLPEYYRKPQGASVWTPILASQVPAATGLAKQKFPVSPGGLIPPLDFSAASPWDSSKWSAGPFTAKLSDSTVEYVWYKFVDQPAIAQLLLDEGELQILQAFVESLHENSGVNGPTIAPPSSGTLATLDARLLVKPPPGLEKGYVPIVIRQYQVTNAEIAALQSLYNATNGANWTNATNWLAGPVYSWHGVTVGNGVMRLDLFNNNLTGTLPTQLGDLKNLQHVELSINHLSGPIPSSISKLTNLTFFSAWNNDLGGPLPSIPKLTKLTLLQLGSNQISGPIPTSFGKLASLENLFLGDNQLSGPLPSAIGKLTKLRQLDVSQNPALTGPLSSNLTNLTLLNTFLFNATNLCEPANGSLSNWLNSIATLQRSGLTCPP